MFAPFEVATGRRESVLVVARAVPESSAEPHGAVPSRLGVVVDVLCRKRLVVRPAHLVAGRRSAVVLADTQTVACRLVLNHEFAVFRPYVPVSSLNTDKNSTDSFLGTSRINKGNKGCPGKNLQALIVKVSTTART